MKGGSILEPGRFGLIAGVHENLRLTGEKMVRFAYIGLHR